MTAALAAVAVPASSANLGPGFDALAVALDLELVATAVEPGPRLVIPEGEGAGEIPTDERNLVWRAFADWCRVAGADVPAVSIRVANAIPLARGLGSSAAAAVAGAGLARALLGGVPSSPGEGSDASDRAVVELVADLEGHPDNAAAAVLGGVVLCTPGQAPVRLAPSGALAPVALVPEEGFATSAARGLLPAGVPLAVAAANGARAAAVLAALIGQHHLRVDDLTDELHEPPRLAAMPATGRLVRTLRAAGVPACLSGAGPSVLAIVDRGDHDRVTDAAGDAAEGFTALPLRWHLAGLRVLPPDLRER